MHPTTYVRGWGYHAPHNLRARMGCWKTRNCHIRCRKPGAARRRSRPALHVASRLAATTSITEGGDGGQRRQRGVGTGRARPCSAIAWEAPRAAAGPPAAHDLGPCAVSGTAIQVGSTAPQARYRVGAGFGGKLLLAAGTGEADFDFAGSTPH